MKPVDFAYAKAHSIDHALSLLKENAGEAALLSGGQSLLPIMNMRLATPALLIDIGHLEILRGIERQGETIRVGAGTRHVEIQRSAVVSQHLPLISQAVEHIAHAAIRNRGTLGGNLALADPASELPACCVALDAKIELTSEGGIRQVAARDFFIDVYETAMQTDEILTAVLIPVTTSNARFAFREFVRRQGDFAIVGIAVHAEVVDGRFETLSPVFFGVGKKPELVERSLAAILGERFSLERADEVVKSLRDELEIFDNLHASVGFKRHLAEHFFMDALKEIHESSQQ